MKMSQAVLLGLFYMLTVAAAQAVDDVELQTKHKGYKHYHPEEHHYEPKPNSPEEHHHGPKPFTFTVYEKREVQGRHGPPVAAWIQSTLYTDKALTNLVGNTVWTGVVYNTSVPYSINWLGDAQFTGLPHGHVSGGIAFSGRGLWNVTDVENFYVIGGSGGFTGAGGTVKWDNTVTPATYTFKLLLPDSSDEALAHELHHGGDHDGDDEKKTKVDHTW